MNYSATYRETLNRSNSLESLCTTSISRTLDHRSFSLAEESVLKTVKSEINIANHKTSSPNLVHTVLDGKLHLLWPQPQQITQLCTDPLLLEDEINIEIISGRKDSNGGVQNIMQVWLSFERCFLKLGCVLNLFPSPVKKNNNVRVLCQVNSAIFKKQEGYCLIVKSNQVRIMASDLPGLHHAICTFLQLAALYDHGVGIPSIYVHDWPTIPCRALLFDLSLDSARTFSYETMKSLINCFSKLKFNQLHLNVKFTSSDDWQLSYTKMELLSLVGYCKSQAISVVPVLEAENGCTLQSLSIMYSSIKQFLMSINSYEYVHIGPNLTLLLLESSDESLQNIWQYLPLDQDQTVFLSKILNGENIHSGLFNVIPVYSCSEVLSEENNFPRDEMTMGCCSATLINPTVNYSITGCPKPTIASIYRTLQKISNFRHLAVITGDIKCSSKPDQTPLAFLLPGMVAAVGLGWNASVHEDYLECQLPNLLNKHIVLDEEEIAGQIIMELGELEVFVHNAWLTDSSFHNSVMYRFLINPDDIELENLTADVFQKALRRIKYCQQQLGKTKLMCFQSGELLAELRLTVDLLLFACRIGRSMVTLGQNPNAICGVSVINAGISNLPATLRTDLANKILGITEEFRAIWLSRHLPTGLQTGLLLFTSLLHKLVPNEANDE